MECPIMQHLFTSVAHRENKFPEIPGVPGVPIGYTLPPEMFGVFGSFWCKMALGEVGVSLP